MAVKLFYSEEKYYNYKKPQYYKAAGHFTQVKTKIDHIVPEVLYYYHLLSQCF